MLLLFWKGIPCQYDLRDVAISAYTPREPAAGGGDGGDVFPGLPWMPTSGGGALYASRTPATASYANRAAGEGSGRVCD